MGATRYRVRYGQNTFKATLAEAIYDDLYRARNRFLHGHPVTATDLRYRRSSRFQPLLQLDVLQQPLNRQRRFSESSVSQGQRGNALNLLASRVIHSQAP